MPGTLEQGILRIGWSGLDDRADVRDATPVSCVCVVQHCDALKAAEDEDSSDEDSSDEWRRMARKKENAKRLFRDVRAKELYRGRIHRWRVSLLEPIGYVDAANEISAIEMAAKEYNISDLQRHQLVVRREG